MLVLIGSPAAPRRGSAWSTLSADCGATSGGGALRAGPGAGVAGSIGGAITRVEQAAALLDVAPGPPLGAPVVETGALPVASKRPRVSTSRSLAIATTALGMFRGCARRFRFRYLLGLEEPVASGQLDLFALTALADESARGDDLLEEADPRALGRAAHRVLQRWPAARWGAGPLGSAPSSVMACAAAS
jgi:ATP-dependent helicase/nuclease subunit A